MAVRTILLITIILVSGCAINGKTPTSDSPTSHSESATSEKAPRIDLRTYRSAPSEPEAEIVAPEPQYDDVWERIRDGFAMPQLSNPYLDNHVRWYRKRPEYIERVVERARPFLFYIVEEIEKRGMPTEIALLPVIESAYRPTAYSRARAGGLWQFVPGTAKRYGVKMNWWYDGRRDVVVSTRAALDYLEFLHTEFDGDWFHALAAYNAGERRIQRAIRRNASQGKPSHFNHLKLTKETRHYVPKLIAFREVISNPEKYDVTLASVPNEPYFSVVDTLGQLDLNVARGFTTLTAADFRHLNAGFKRWATDPEGPHRLLVPVDQAPELAAAVEDLPESQRLEWTYYRIEQGDTLGGIARKYGVSVRAIQISNNLNGTLIRAGKDLLIPLSGLAATGEVVELASQDNPLVHRVRSGDTLWGIARRYNVYVNQLARWNSIRTNDLLHLGQSIVVYVN